MLGSVFDHVQEVVDAMFRNRPFFGVVLHGEHFAHDRLLENLDGLKARPGLFEPSSVHISYNLIS